MFCCIQVREPYEALVGALSDSGRATAALALPPRPLRGVHSSTATGPHSQQPPPHTQAAAPRQQRTAVPPQQQAQPRLPLAPRTNACESAAGHAPVQVKAEPVEAKVRLPPALLHPCAGDQVCMYEADTCPRQTSYVSAVYTTGCPRSEDAHTWGAGWRSTSHSPCIPCKPSIAVCRWCCSWRSCAGCRRART